jgi:glycosyltransferase involved in cell wall biosynthesis
MQTLARDPKKLRVIPCGVDGAVFDLAAAGEVAVGARLLFVGAVRPVKGVDVLLRALAILAERGRPERLTVVGDPYFRSYRQAYEQARRLSVELGIADRVEFVGGADPPEVARHMRESAVVVLPSRRETLGVVLVEALACGTPVVATRCGGPADIVTDQVGRLVPAEDPQALADAIASVVDERAAYDPALLRAHALNTFSWERVTQQYRDLYSEILASR